MDESRMQNAINATESANKDIQKHAQQRANEINETIQRLFNYIEGKIESWTDTDLDDIFEKIFVSNRNKDHFMLVVDLSLPIYKFLIHYDDENNILTETCNTKFNSIDCYIYSSPLGDGGTWNKFSSYPIPEFENIYNYTQPIPFGFDKNRNKNSVSNHLENHYSFFGLNFNQNTKNYQAGFSLFGPDNKPNVERLFKLIEERLTSYGLNLQPHIIDHANCHEEGYISVKFVYVLKNPNFKD